MRTAAFTLILCLGLGLGLWLLFGHQVQATNAWCGELAGPAPSPEPEGCETQLRRLGRDLAVYRQHGGKFPESLEEFNPLPTCPWTGQDYRYVLNADDTKAWLYCPGRLHGEKANWPAYDFAKNEVSPEPLRPDESFAQAWWLFDAETYPAALEEARRSGDPQMEARCLLLLGRPKEALEKTDDPILRAHALMKLGEYAQAYALLPALKDEPEQASAVAFMQGEHSRTLELAPASSWLNFWVPFAENHPQEGFKAAAAWLEAHGYGRYESPYAVLVATLSAMASPDADIQSQGKALMRTALRKLPRQWPFPVVQLVNGELTYSQVHPEGLSQETDLHTYAAVLAQARGDAARARELFEWVEREGDKESFETHVSRLRLKGLR